MSDTIVHAASSAARETLRGNLRTGYSAGGGQRYHYTCPSPDSYPFQWSWDSAFHAIALTHVDLALARRELDSLLHGVDGEGFLPHMLLWQDDLRDTAVRRFRIRTRGWTSATVAPPVLARAVQRVHQAEADPWWLSAVLPRVIAVYEWLHDHRRDPRTGLLVTVQPDESGLDSSPKYDAALGLDPAGDVGPDWHDAMRRLLDDYATAGLDAAARSADRFRWHDVLFNSIYVNALNVLCQLCRSVPGFGHLAWVFEDRAAQTLAALCAHCWDDERGVFWDIDLVRGTPVRCLTASSLMPLILRDLPATTASRLVEEHLLNEKEFWVPYPVPSVAISEPTFDPDFHTGAIFRGSSWVNLNWYLCHGLSQHGYPDVAADLAGRTVDMAARSGMRECYGPFDAAGHGATSFGWSSLVLDLMDRGPRP